MRVIETKDPHGGTVVEIFNGIDPSGVALSGESHLSVALQLVNPTLSCSLTGNTRSLSATFIDAQNNIDPSGVALSDEPRLSVDLQLANPTLSCILSGSTRSLNATLALCFNTIERYDGEYEVRPKVEEQSLPTKNKLLSEDVNIEGIPYFETTNESGGYTVIIG